MGRYFDYREWDIDEICDNLRQRIAEAKKPLPKKVWFHSVSIVYRTGENSYTYTHSLSYSNRWNIELKTAADAEKYIDTCAWVKKVKDNFWVDIDEKKTYTDKDGNEIMCHYEIRESDYEQYEDGEYHYPYTDEEKRLLSETLYKIEEAQAYIRAYDYCCDQCSFGDDGYTKAVNEELEKFRKEFTEELPPDEEDDD